MADSLLADLAPATLAALCAFAFLAGFVDAVVGGGGLIQVPAMFVLLPNAAPALLLGTNKFAAVWGTASATWQYARRVPIDWRWVIPASASAALCSFLGARAVTLIDNASLKPLLLVLMVAVLVYTLWRKDFGALHVPRLTPAILRRLGIVVGAVIGFYDGFFGPGTGSFLIFAFVGLFGFSFLFASASAKVINTVTNITALVWFVSQGSVLYSVAIPMAVSNVAGSLAGSRLAMAKGSRFIRILFIIVVAALIARYGWDIASG